MRSGDSVQSLVDAGHVADSEQCLRVKIAFVDPLTRSYVVPLGELHRRFSEKCGYPSRGFRQTLGDPNDFELDQICASRLKKCLIIKEVRTRLFEQILQPICPELVFSQQTGEFAGIQTKIDEIAGLIIFHHVSGLSMSAEFMQS